MGVMRKSFLGIVLTISLLCSGQAFAALCSMAGFGDTACCCSIDDGNCCQTVDQKTDCPAFTVVPTSTEALNPKESPSMDLVLLSYPLMVVVGPTGVANVGDELDPIPLQQRWRTGPPLRAPPASFPSYLSFAINS